MEASTTTSAAPAAETSQAPSSEVVASNEIASTSTLPPPPPSAPTTTTDTLDTTVETSNEVSAPPTMTKSAMKRQRRQEAYEQSKLERRAREKLQRKERQAEKRRLIEEGKVEAPERKKRKKGEMPTVNQHSKKYKGKKEEFGARIVIDVAFDELMHDKEIKSMNSQIAYCYSANRGATRPFPLLISGLSGRLKDTFEKREDHLNWKGVEWWDEGFEKLYEGSEEGDNEGESKTMEALPTSSTSVTPIDAAAPSDEAPSETTASTSTVPTIKMGALAGKPRSTCPKSRVIYLTGDSHNVLTSIDPTCTYILGGIVDRNRHKFLCLDKANKLGIQHAQLPIGEYLPEMTTRKVLTVNQVFEIMVNYVESERENREKALAEATTAEGEDGKTEEELKKIGGDWREALRKVMPERKFDKDGRKKTKAAKRPNSNETATEGAEVYVAEEGDGSDDHGQAEEEVYVAKDDEDDVLAKVEEKREEVAREEDRKTEDTVMASVDTV